MINSGTDPRKEKGIFTDHQMSLGIFGILWLKNILKNTNPPPFTFGEHYNVRNGTAKISKEKVGIQIYCKFTSN